MEALVVSLLVTIISALAFLAYNHPEQYARFATKTADVGGTGLIAICLWNFGLTTGYREAAGAGSKGESGYLVPDFILFGGGLFVLYVILLRTLPVFGIIRKS